MQHEATTAIWVNGDAARQLSAVTVAGGDPRETIIYKVTAPNDNHSTEATACLEPAIYPS